MEWRDRIVADAGVQTGKPVIKGTRLTAQFVLDLLANGWTEAQILDNYPGVKTEDVRACLAYASEMATQERVFRRDVVA